MHAEPGGSWWPVWIVIALTAVGTAVDSVLRSPADALSVVLCGILVLLSGVLPVVLSKRHYNRLELTEDTLRIGKERIAIADLDPASLDEQAAGRRYTGTFRGWFGDPASDVRVAGGSSATIMGVRYVVVKVRGQPARIAVATRDPVRVARIIQDLAAQLDEQHPELAAGKQTGQAD